MDNMIFWREKKVINANFNNRDTLAHFKMRYLGKMIKHFIIPLLLIRTSF